MSGALGLAGCGGHVQTASYDSYSEADTADYSAGRTRIDVLNKDGKKEIPSWVHEGVAESMADFFVPRATTREALDEGLKHLVGSSQLRWLLLSRNEITDEGLKQLEQMKNLGRLTVDGTKVTSEGVDRLKKAVSGLSVDL